MRQRLQAFLSTSGPEHPRYVPLSLAVLVVALVLIGFSVWRSVQQVNTLLDHSSRVEQKHQVLLLLSSTLSHVKDAETGQRGFLLTGRDEYLEPYLASIAVARQNMAVLKAGNDQYPERLSLLEEASQLMELKFAELDATIRARRQAGSDAAIAIVQSGEGKRAMDALRDVFDRIGREETDRLAARQAMIDPAAGSLIRSLVIRASLLGLLLAVAWILNTLLSTRQSQLRRSRELIATTLSSIGDGVIVTDVQGRVTFMNPEAERLTGWTNKDANCKPLSEIFRIINEGTRLTVENPVEKVLRFGAVVGLANHTLLIRRDGSEIPIDDSAAPIRENGSRDGPMFGVVLCFRDFTEHKEMERKLLEHQGTLETQIAARTAELTKAHERVRVADRMAAVGTMASGLAHDMRNVLMPLSVRMNAVLSAPGLSDLARSDLSAVVALIGHLREMAKNLSLFARDPDHQGTEGHTDLSAWSTGVQGLVNASVTGGMGGPSSWISVRWDIAPGLPHIAVAPHRLTQAVLNLVHNARDAIVTARGSDSPSETRPRGCITVSAHLADHHVVLSVADDGCGMTDEVRERCTEAFFTTKNRPGEIGLSGSGLGMALVQSIATQAGGRIDIQSQPGQGTTVALTFPISPPAHSLPSPPSSIGRASVTIEDTRVRSIIVVALDSLKYHARQGPPDETSDLWITDCLGVEPRHAAEFLKLGSRRRVIALGCDERWNLPGVTLLDPGLSISKLRAAISGDTPPPVA